MELRRRERLTEETRASPCCCPALPAQSLGRNALASPLSRLLQLPKRSNTCILAHGGCDSKVMSAWRQVMTHALRGGCRAQAKGGYCIALRYGYGLTAAPPLGWISK